MLFSSSGVGSQMGELCDQGKRGKEAGALGLSSALTVCTIWASHLRPGHQCVVFTVGIIICQFESRVETQCP